MAEQPTPPKDYGTKLAEDRTNLALVRTRLALERTLDAWVRTGISMIGFGFTIYKFLQELQQKQGFLPDRPHAARNFGLALVITGILGLIAAIYQHVHSYRQIGLRPLQRPMSVSLVTAVLVALLGLLVLLALAANIGPF